MFRLPKTRPEFWAEKIEGNRMRDERNYLKLAESGWRVAIVWECALRGTGSAPDATVRRLGSWIRSRKARTEIAR
jgi:DNA mismatch endonuclease (patch repair protein)